LTAPSARKALPVAFLGPAQKPGGLFVDVDEKELNMNKACEVARNFLREEDGVTAIEYGLIAALIAVVIIASVGTVGNNLKNVFTYISNQLSAALG
jgi:pilus assembly protein Flp/PilA